MNAFSGIDWILGAEWSFKLNLAFLFVAGGSTQSQHSGMNVSSGMKKIVLSL